MNCRRACLSMLALALTGAAATAFAAEVRIELRPQALVQGAQVRLGDLAYLHTSDLALIQRLVALPLGHAPRAGEQTSVQRAAIERWVRLQAGTSSEAISWAGSQEVQVSSAVHELSGTAIEQTARAALQGWLAQHSARSSVEALDVPRAIALPVGQVEMRVRPLAPPARPEARQLVWVDVWVDRQFVRAVPVNFAVSAYRDAWVATNGIARGEELLPQMLERREIDVTRTPVKTSNLPQPFVSGQRAVRPIAAGQVLASGDLEAVPVVARGEWVTLLARTGAIELESRVEALQDGQMGQMVKVRSGTAPGSLVARVIAPGRVEVRP